MEAQRDFSPYSLIPNPYSPLPARSASPLTMKSERTRSQERILQLLKQCERGISAQDIYVELRNRNQSVGLATVYRALDGLKLEGTVQVRTLSSGESLYSCVQADKHHLTCLHCGRSIPIEECPVEQLEDRLQKIHDFKIYYHTLEFFGLCTTCTPLASDRPIESNSAIRHTHQHSHD
jgi:Fur family ferric uptake transcriptional regulator